MAIKKKPIKKVVKKAVKKDNGNIVLQEGQFCKFRYNGTPMIGEIIDKGSEELDINFNCYSEKDFNDIYFSKGINIQKLLSDFDITNFEIISKAEASRLDKIYEALHIEIFDYTCTPKYIDGEMGYFFGCGKEEFTIKQMSNFIKVFGKAKALRDKLNKEIVELSNELDEDIMNALEDDSHIDSRRLDSFDDLDEFVDNIDSKIAEAKKLFKIK